MWTIKRTLRHRPNTSHAINSVAPVHRNWSLMNGPRHTLAEGDHQRFHNTFTFSTHSKVVLVSQDTNKLHRPNIAHTGYRPCQNLQSQAFASTPPFPEQHIPRYTSCTSDDHLQEAGPFR